MTEISYKKIKQHLNNSKNKRIAVIGDVMLDKYVYGDVNRISPEAPVQVVDIKNTEYKLGGAANVANNIKSLGCEPILIGIIGDDFDGDNFLETMKMQDLKLDGIVKDITRPTTAKTRVIAHSQHILRIDLEKKLDVIGKISEKITNFFEKNIKTFESVIIQDYNKGVMSKNVIKKITETAIKARKKIFVDPKFDNFFEYKNVFVFKPNRKEIQDVMGLRLDGDDSVIDAGRKLLDIIKSDWLIITRGEKGMMLFDKENNKTVVHNIPTKARRVADVSGAGDTVISTIAVMTAGGANIKEAVTTANLAAGVVCEEVGIIPIYKESLLETLKNSRE